MFDRLNPYSVKTLRKRASIAKVYLYKRFLEVAADQLESGKVSKDDVKKAIQLVQAGMKLPKKLSHAYEINCDIRAAQILKSKLVLSGKIKPETIETKNKVNQAQLESLRLELVPNQ